MKNIKSIIVLAVLISTSVSAFAQKQKMGHINSNELILLMPERESLEKELQTYAKELETQMQLMTQELQNKYQDYEANQASMTEVIKQSKVQEINDLDQRVKQFQQTAQADLQQKESSLLQPLVEKAKKAIADVANEGGYLYVFDSGVGVLLHMPESDDIMPLVKKKLAIQ